MNDRNEQISSLEIEKFSYSLAKTKKVRGKLVKKTSAEIAGEAKKKLTERHARELTPRYCLYVLRHSYATNALQKGVDPITLGELMGHKDASMVAKVYQHVAHDPKFMLEQAKKASGH